MSCQNSTTASKTERPPLFTPLCSSAQPTIPASFMFPSLCPSAHQVLQNTTITRQFRHL
jgi:hypothetical protein